VKPPFQITPKVVQVISEISILLGKYEGLQRPAPQPQLRRQNQVRTVKDSLAIEGNTLDLKQVTAIFDGKRVLGPQKDILEVKNAIQLYERLDELNPLSVKDLLKAHGILMRGLNADAGKFRSGAVGVMKGSRVSHVAPPAKQVPKLMTDLFQFLKQERTSSDLLNACVFHYELEFIHPFSDGNGRMGRFWQSLILTRHHPIFNYLPVESLIKERQPHYYLALEKSDKLGDSTAFIEFSLETIRDALGELLEEIKPSRSTPQSRLSAAQNHFQQRQFSRKDYLILFKSLSTSTASRDLAAGVSSGVLKKIGTQALAQYEFKSRAKN